MSTANNKPTRSRTSYQTFNERFTTLPPTLTTTCSLASSSTAAATTTTEQQQQPPYNGQYSSIYAARLTSLKPKCIQTFERRERQQQQQEKISSSTDTNDNNNNNNNNNNNDNDENTTAIVNRIIELQEDTTSFIVGTVIKDCPQKPKINFDTNQLYHENGLSYLGTPFDDDGDNDNEKGKGNEKDDKNGENNKKNNEIVVESPLYSTTYCDITNDTIVLEDESGRIELSFDPSESTDTGTSNDNSTKNQKDVVQRWKLDLVTGAIVGVKGRIHLGSNVFLVEDVYYPMLGPHREVELEEGEEQDEEEACVLLMSGLDCGGYKSNKRNSSTSLKRELVIDYITGHLSAPSSSSNGRFISRVIVAGGGCAKPIQPEHNAANSWSTTATNTVTGSSSDASKKPLDQQSKDNLLQQQMKEMTLPIRELDLFLSEICSNGIPVDYIPGLYDPTNANWPQRPIHECLVPNANMFTTMLYRSPNPYEACVGNKVLLGSDGLNILDLRCYLGQIKEDVDVDAMDTTGDDTVKNGKKVGEVEAVPTIKALQTSLEYNHLVPTGPCNVPTFPFEVHDPFVIEYAPHVYFCGNCESFETKLIDIHVNDGGDEDTGASTKVQQVRLICIPSFVRTGQAVLLNLKSLECNVIEFDDVVLDVDDIDGVHDEKKME